MKNRTFAFCLLPVLILLAGCSGKPERTPETRAKQEESTELRLSGEQIRANDLALGHPENHLFSRRISATGYLDALPGNKRVISAGLGGTIKDMKVMKGEFVKAGQPLFKVENPEFIQLQEDYLTASGNLRFLKEEQDRQKQLSLDQATSQKSSQKASAEYESMLGRVHALQSKIQLANIPVKEISPENIFTSAVIRAPISGFITEISVENGQFMSAQNDILEIVQPNPLILELSVFEKDFLYVRENQTVNFSLPGASGPPYTARVLRVGKKLGENRTVTVTAITDSKDATEQLIPGMFVRAEIISGEFPALSLPTAAVIDYEDQSFVLVKTNPEDEFWILKQLPVKTGFRDGTRIEILPESGLTTGHQVMTKGVNNYVSN